MKDGRKECKGKKRKGKIVGWRKEGVKEKLKKVKERGERRGKGNQDESKAIRQRGKLRCKEYIVVGKEGREEESIKW